MPKSNDEERDERKRAFVEATRQKRCRGLLEPLKAKLEGFFAGKATADDVFKTVHYIAKQSDELVKFFKNRPDVVLAAISMDENRYTTEINEMGVRVRQSDITWLFVDAIVNPADPSGAMAAGVAAAIKAAGGEEIEKEAKAKAPIAVGKAVATAAGALPNPHVIHAAVAEAPGAPSSKENVAAAAAAALRLAEELECVSIALPGLGTGAGKLSPADAAEAVIGAIKAHAPKHLADVTIVDRSDAVLDAFTKALEKFDEEDR